MNKFLKYVKALVMREACEKNKRVHQACLKIRGRGKLHGMKKFKLYGPDIVHNNPVNAWIK